MEALGANLQQLQQLVALSILAVFFCLSIRGNLEMLVDLEVEDCVNK
jgi:hypothetical protein